LLQPGESRIIFRLLTVPANARECRKSHIIEADMKPETHPAYNDIKVICSCGSSFETRSTVGKDLSIEVCSQCHPFYTGKQKIVDAGGRVDKFRRRYGRG
jgi:large subunit ribosomal protein L31